MVLSNRPNGGPATSVRHPGDLFKLVVGTITLVASGVAAREGQPGLFEVNLFRLIADLPGILARPFGAIMQIGSIVVVPLASAAALLFRRVRMAADIVVSGGLAWVIAKLLKNLIGRGRPGAVLHDVLIRDHAATGPGFPSGHVAVAAALAAATSPYLPRRARRAAWGAVALVALARVYIGAQLPVDVLGGAALGWSVGAALHLLFGAPGPRPSVDGVRRALEDSGIGASDLRLAPVDGRGSTAFVARLDAGSRMFIKTVSREQRNADWLFKAWRLLAFRRIEDEAPFATPKQQIEHEAYLALLAERTGVRTPRIVASGLVEGGAAFLAEELIPGRTLDTVPQDEVQDDVLRQVWGEVRLLHQAQIAHRDLRRANVMVDLSGKVWLLDFGFAEAAATAARLGQDVAEMLTSLALIIGAERALCTANNALARDSLVRALPFLQPPALSASTRHELKARPGLLAELRTGIASAATIELPPVQPITRVRARTILLLLAGAIAVHLLLPQVGELRPTLRALGSARPAWLLAALLASMLSYMMAAIALGGAAGRPLPLRRTVAVQVASSFSNRLVPGGFGGLGTNARYLERSGFSRVAALAAVALNAAAGLIVHFAVLLLSIALLGSGEPRQVELPFGWVALVAAGSVLTIAGLVRWSTRVRETIVGPAHGAARALTAIVRQPRQALRLFGGSIGVTGTYALALVASLHAFGARAPFVDVVAVYLGASALSSVSPTPGGLGAMEATLVAGLTALGVGAGAAVAGVLAFRLLTFWLPIVPGILVFRRLSRDGVI